ncbi:site-specific integrase [Bauldia litoralis]|uniref:Site-specific recombinase XerD n=1 Tax=Bauldia litoralis TaxID=665467 RepID=A0A1G6AJU2_9HYPH|nr:site-specific integrase [Bauldia litoralis]SDB08668.1 Site-specific recombinase XerD [Bauldia litoralis]
MPVKITKRAVDQASAASKRDATIWDTEVKGFGLRCRQSGAKFYVLKTRIGGRQRWITIGRHGSPWTPDSARQEALRLLGYKAGGNDPASDRDNQKGVISVEELGERFLTEYVLRRCKPRTICEYQRAVELFINPTLGRHRISDISRTDVARLHYEHRLIPYQANRTLGVLSKMMGLAEEWGLRPEGSNPCVRVRKYPEIKRERYLSQEELRRLGAVLTEAEGTESPFVIGAIRLLVLTGARLSEILTLKWSYVDVETATLRLPDSKTGAKTIFLNPPAIAVLRSIPRMDGNPFVIAGEKAAAHLVDLQKPWRRIRAKAGLDDLRIHDLRHSFASVAAGAGLSLPMIGKLLGHSQPATTARYAHLASEPMRAAADRIGAEISISLTGEFLPTGDH